jgi:hypothetical protein
VVLTPLSMFAFFSVHKIMFFHELE